ncbi:hypothetical protein L2E82_12447 [Cichorium intybus]|uniref:Uncharacterized protein n=1 Tax=Cichorium intybus TaxID=13427 RepID=A0ACB9GG83_CICIN|nr:hypothetical protein L2E82_12447 [Cichorium intybus]
MYCFQRWRSGLVAGGERVWSSRFVVFSWFSLMAGGWMSMTGDRRFVTMEDCFLLENRATLRAMSEFGGILLYFHICDRTTFIAESTKSYNRELFLFLVEIGITLQYRGGFPDTLKVKGLLANMSNFSIDLNVQRSKEESEVRVGGRDSCFRTGNPFHWSPKDERLFALKLGLHVPFFIRPISLSSLSLNPLHRRQSPNGGSRLVNPQGPYSFPEIIYFSSNHPAI